MRIIIVNTNKQVLSFYINLSDIAKIDIDIGIWGAYMTEANNQQKKQSTLHDNNYVPNNPKSKHTKNKLGYLMLLLAVLVVGVLLGKFWADRAVNQNKTTHNANPKGVATQIDKDPKVVDEQPVLAVEVIEPQTGNVKLNLKAHGTVTPKDTASISGRVSGVAIEKVLVNTGDWVKKGQTLALFDTQSLQQNVMQAEASVMQAKATYAKAKADVARVKPLLKMNAVSKQEVDAYITAQNQAKASLVAAQSQLNNQKITLNNSKVVAPTSGIISKKTAQIGVIPQGPLFTIIQGGRLEWKADINPEKISKIKLGMPVLVQTATGEQISGKVSRIDPVAGSNRQVSVFASLAPNKNIQSGMLLAGEFILGTQSQQVVPVSAVVGSDGYDYLMLVNDIETRNLDGKTQTVGRIKRFKVELGGQYGDAVAVKSQIPANAVIVRQSGSFLSEGDLVNIVQPQANQSVANRPDNANNPTASGE